MKRSIQLSLLVLAFFLLFPSCDKEPTGTNQSGSIPEVQEYRVRDILEGEILANTKVAEKLDRFTNAGGKMTDKDLNLKKPDITVIVDRATYVEKDGYGSYTFPIMQDKEENIRNVLLAPDGNQGYDAFPMAFPPNKGRSP